MVYFDRLFKWITTVLLVLLLLIAISHGSSISNLYQRVNDNYDYAFAVYYDLNKKINNVYYELERVIDAITSSTIYAVYANANKNINEKGSISYANDMCYDL